MRPTDRTRAGAGALPGPATADSLSDCPPIPPHRHRRLCRHRPPTRSRRTRSSRSSRSARRPSQAPPPSSAGGSTATVSLRRLPRRPLPAARAGRSADAGSGAGLGSATRLSVRARRSTPRRRRWPPAAAPQVPEPVSSSKRRRSRSPRLSFRPQRSRRPTIGPAPKPVIRSWPAPQANDRSSPLRDPDREEALRVDGVVPEDQELRPGSRLLWLSSRRLGARAARVAPVMPGRIKSVAASPQSSVASATSHPAAGESDLSSQAVPIRSTGTKPGDVAEEGKLFERVSFESFDKSPQS